MKIQNRYPNFKQSTSKTSQSSPRKSSASKSSKSFSKNLLKNNKNLNPDIAKMIYAFHGLPKEVQKQIIAKQELIKAQNSTPRKRKKMPGRETYMDFLEAQNQIKSDKIEKLKKLKDANRIYMLTRKQKSRS